MDSRHYVFAGGGTGGHLFPGLAVAEALRAGDPRAEITFLTTTRALDRELLGRTTFTRIEQPVRPFTLHPLRVVGFWWSWNKSVRRARAILKRTRPRAVLGLGGYAAGPPVVAAHSLGIRTATLNPDARPGRANRYLARHVDLVVLQWDVSRAYFRAGTKCATFGCPIRSEFRSASREEGRGRFGLESERPTLLVTGASQGARNVNRAMQHVWPRFAARHPNWQLLHLTGRSDEDETRTAYTAAGAAATVVAFTYEMWLALAAADTVVSRAGASTLAELTALGIPSILMPYPYHRDRHQYANAHALVDNGAALLVEDRCDPEANAGALLDALERLTDPTIRSATGRAARQLSRTDAADAVAHWMAT